MKSGWKTKKLGEVCSFLNRGISPKYLDVGGICVLNQKCIRDNRVSYEPSRRHDVEAKKIGNERFIQAGDVLVNSTGTGTLGRVAQVGESPPEPTTVDSHVTIVRPAAENFYPPFFGYMLIVIEDAIKDAGDGCGGQTELARSVLADKFAVSFPEAIPEQQRIVGILDEAFDSIATAKANAEKNLQNARALFESHLLSIFTNPGEGWMKRTLGEVCEATQGVQVPKSQQSSIQHPTYKRYLYISDFENDRNLKYVKNVYPSKVVTPQDIIVANTGSAGKIYRGIDGVLSNNLFKVSFDSEKIDRDFLFYFVTISSE
jgi:type I restriction enzyme S subunit